MKTHFSILMLCAASSLCLAQQEQAPAPSPKAERNALTVAEITKQLSIAYDYLMAIDKQLQAVKDTQSADAAALQLAPIYQEALNILNYVEKHSELEDLIQCSARITREKKYEAEEAEEALHKLRKAQYYGSASLKKLIEGK